MIVLTDVIVWCITMIFIVPLPFRYPTYMQGYNNSGSHAGYDVPQNYHRDSDGANNFISRFIMFSCFIFSIDIMVSIVMMAL
jgi:hypothetical protein